MRPIINSTLSLDGVINHMEKWHFDYVDDESQDLAYEQLIAAEALLMGRKTYEVYAGSWGTRDGQYADRINAMPKLVASTTLTAPTWPNTTVIDTDLISSVRTLKSSDGGPILMHGFGPVAKALLSAGLLDELHLWYNPAFAGVGGADDMLLTPGLNVSLSHTATRTLSSGVVVISYRAAPS